MTRRIQGEGLLMPKQQTRRGGLIIEFDIVFSDRLSESAREILADTLPRLLLGGWNLLLKRRLSGKTLKSNLSNGRHPKLMSNRA